MISDMIIPMVYPFIDKKPQKCMAQFYLRNGIPNRAYLLAYFKNVGGVLTDSIGLSVSYYNSVGPVWQPLLFTNSTTPSSMTVAQALANEHLNEFNVVGNDKFFAIYDINTPWSVIDKIWKYGDLDAIDLPDPWDDTVIFSDNYYIWSEA